MYIFRILVIFTILIVKRKNGGLSKKVIQIWLYLLFGLGVMVIQMKHPELVITTAALSMRERNSSTVGAEITLSTCEDL